MPSIIGKDISKAAELLAQNEIVAIPTETVYGLAANALNPDAVLKIFEAKNRPHFDPLIVHISAKTELNKYILSVPLAARKLIDAFWPGPLTLVLPKRKIIPDLVTSGLPEVAIRMPSHPVALQLLNLLPFPLAAPSANPFGYISPTTAQHVAEQLRNKIPYILDGGPAYVGVESTIVRFENEMVIVLRLGGIAVEEIEEVCEKVEIQINPKDHPIAPGQLSSHYAPRKPLYVGDIAVLMNKFEDKKTGIISFGKTVLNNVYKEWNLSQNADLHEAAKNLFSILREADISDVDIIIAGFVPDIGLGKAINDRLKRAGVQNKL